MKTFINNLVLCITFLLDMLQKNNMLKTAGVFFDEPTKTHYLLEISRNINLAHTSIKRNLDKLLKLGLIKEFCEKKGKRKFPIYKANLDNKAYKKYKKIYNLISILDISEFIEKKLMPKSIVLFGSYQKAEDIEESDVDIFIECKKETLDLKKFEKKIKRKIQLHFNKNFNDYPKELKNNIINGVVLSGYLEGCK